VLKLGEILGVIEGGGVRAEGGTMIQYVLFSLLSIPGTKKTRKKQTEETNARVSRQRSLTKEYKTFLSSFYSWNQKNKEERNECKSFKTTLANKGIQDVSLLFLFQEPKKQGRKKRKKRIQEFQDNAR